MVSQVGGPLKVHFINSQLTIECLLFADPGPGTMKDVLVPAHKVYSYVVIHKLHPFINLLSSYLLSSYYAASAIVGIENTTMTTIVKNSALIELTVCESDCVCVCVYKGSQ